MDADTVLEVGAQKSVGICFAQVVFGEERKLFDVVDTLNVLGLYTFLIHEIAVVGDVLIDMFDLFDDLFVLDLKNFLAGCGLDLFLVIAAHFITPFLTLHKKSVAPVEVPRLCERIF